ncbi:MAG: hypothetical protein JWN14_2681 [Chthonomonadales bacterium]|nr:hypothetical protein [Chthonomonadales bacterium]
MSAGMEHLVMKVEWHTTTKIITASSESFFGSGYARLGYYRQVFSTCYTIRNASRRAISAQSVRLEFPRRRQSRTRALEDRSFP